MTNEEQQQQQVQQELLTRAKENSQSKTESFTHAIIVLFVLASATALRAANDLDTATLSTVYGAALGFATGLTIKGRVS